MPLEVRLKKKLDEFNIDVDFEVRENILGILGASGCGKSMTLKAIAGIIEPDEGKIVLNGEILFDSEKKINIKPQNRKVGYLFQNYALFPNMTVRQNIGAGLEQLNLSKEELNSRVSNLINKFKLEGLEDRYPKFLSGGQQQRVALARILAYEPSVILLDEPFSAMDTFLKEKLQVELSNILKKYNGITIMVSHDREEIYKLTQDIMIIDKGKKLGIGGTKELFENPKNAQVARLTGCKNISNAKKISDYEVRALDWGINFKTKNKVTAKVTGVGIRAHDFYVPKDLNNENAFKIEVVNTMEAPFEWNIIVKSGKSQIWWKIAKEKHDIHKLNNSLEYLCVDSDKVLIFE